MPTTPNFSWVMPDPTDFVTNLPADFETFGDAVDATVKSVKDTADAAIPETLIDAAGDLIYGSAADTAARLPIGAAGQVLTVNSGASAPEWTTISSGGLTWTQRHRGQFAFRTIAYNGSNLWVAAGGDGILATSPDGYTWTTRTSGFGSNNIRKVIYANSLWVAVGTGGLISTSTDGITWTARTANVSTNAINDVTYGGGYFVAVAVGGGTTNTGGITYSTDGITWTRKSQSVAVGQTYNSVIYNGTNFVVGADISTNNMLYASDPSSTWTLLNRANGQNITSIHFDGTRTIFSNSDQDWYYSASATIATNTQIQNILCFADDNNAVRRTFYYNGRIYQSGFYYQDFSTTPSGTSNNYMNNGVMSLSPGSKFSKTTPYIQNQTEGIWAGAAGLIMGAGNGEIWTTF